MRDISSVKQEIINFPQGRAAEARGLRRHGAHGRAASPRTWTSTSTTSTTPPSAIWRRCWRRYKETVEALEATSESVPSHQLNDVLRVLTVLSVVFLPLTLIASIFGMNVHVPGEGAIEPFWVVIGVMLAVGGAMIAFFRKRRWLLAAPFLHARVTPTAWRSSKSTVTATDFDSLERLAGAFGSTKPSKRMLVIVNPYATTVSDRLGHLVVYALQGRYAGRLGRDRGARPRHRALPRGGGGGLRRRLSPSAATAPSTRRPTASPDRTRR